MTEKHTPPPHRETFAEMLAGRRSRTAPIARIGPPSEDRAPTVLQCIAASLDTTLPEKKARQLAAALAITIPPTSRIRNALDVEIATLKCKCIPPCKDPCDFIMKHGGAAFQEVVNGAEHSIDYKFRRIVERYDGAGPNARAAAVRQAIEWFGTYLFYQQEGDDPTEGELLLRGQIYLRLTHLSGLTVDQVRDLIEPQISKQKQTYHAKIYKIREAAGTLPASDKKRNRRAEHAEECQAPSEAAPAP